MTGISLLLVGLDQGSNESWSSPAAITFLALSVPCILGFGYIEARVAAEPFAPGRVIFERSNLAAYLSNFFGLAAWFGTLFYLPLFYQAVYEVNATHAGLRLLPGIISGVTGSLLSGLIMQRTGSYYKLCVLSYGAETLGILILTVFAGPLAHLSLSKICLTLGLALGGLSSGSAITVSLIALLSSSPMPDQAITTACSYLFRSLGSVVGLSVQAALLQNMLRLTLRKRLGSGGDAQRLAQRIRDSLDFVKTLDPLTRDVVRSAYRDSAVAVFALIVALAALALLASCKSGFC